MSKDLQPKSKLYLGYAAQLVAKISDQIEDNYEDELPTDLIEEFKITSKALSEGVDRRIAVADAFEQSLELLKRKKDHINSVIKRMEEAYDRFKETTREIVANSPDITFKGELGKLSVRKTRPSLKVLCATEKKSFQNMVDDETVELFGIDESHLKYVSFLQLNTEKIREDIIAGKIVDYAQLIEKTSLYGLKTPKARVKA